MRTEHFDDDRFDRALVGGLGAGLATSLIANVAGAFAGQASQHEITPRHVLVAAVAANVAGAFLLRVLRRKVGHASSVYAFIALTLAGAMTLWLARSSSLLELRVGTVLHVTVALSSTTMLAVFYPRMASATTGSRVARALTTIAALVTAAASQLADFDASHLYHPDWTPHARYHAMLVIGMMTGLGLLSLALVWQPAPPETQATRRSIAAMICLAVWAPFLLALGIPETSSWPDGFVHRMPVNGNLVLAIAVIASAVASLALDRRVSHHRSKTSSTSSSMLHQSGPLS